MDYFSWQTWSVEFDQSSDCLFSCIKVHHSCLTFLFLFIYLSYVGGVEVFLSNKKESIFFHFNDFRCLKLLKPGGLSLERGPLGSQSLSNRY